MPWFLTLSGHEQPVDALVPYVACQSVACWCPGSLHFLAISSLLMPWFLTLSGHQHPADALVPCIVWPSAACWCPGSWHCQAISILLMPWFLALSGHQQPVDALVPYIVRPSAACWCPGSWHCLVISSPLMPWFLTFSGHQRLLMPWSLALSGHQHSVDALVPCIVLPSAAITLIMKLSQTRSIFLVGIYVSSAHTVSKDPTDHKEWKKKWIKLFNTLRPRQNGRHFPDNIFRHIFLNEHVENSIQISLEFVP